MKMKLKERMCFLVVSLFAEVVSATHQITCPTEPIQAEEGGDVSLQCRLDPSVDLRKETLDFTRADLNREDDVVHSYSDEKDRTYRQMDQYRGRTTLIHEDLIRGIISLNISSLTLTDSGLYTCYVPGLADSATITLTVGESAEFNTEFPSEESETVKKFVPKSDGCDLKKCLKCLFLI
uniref:Ig-like domain-containing protein n=1 Tax=Lates calcarifer TaxID=8187 RepID=A0A4W6DIF3_LATCA